ncbi:DMT family transporter [Rhizobium leguminosarum]|nr:DMT family transporter [Rhizobium leguminosarum]
MKFLPQLAIALAMFLWSINFIWSKDVFTAYSPLSIIFFRLVVASVFVLGLKRAFNIREKIKREHLPRFALLSFFSPFLYFIGEGYGIFLTESTLSALIVATVPVVFPAITFILLREKISLTGIAGLVLAFAGLAFTIVDPANLHLVYSLQGLLFLALSVGSAIAYIILAKQLLEEYRGITVVGAQNAFAAVYYLPFVLVFDGSHILHHAPTLTTVLAILFLGVFCSALAYILYAFAIARLPLWQANAFENLIPIFTATLSFFWLHETLSAKDIAGFLIVIAGIAVSQWGSLRDASGGLSPDESPSRTVQ